MKELIIVTRTGCPYCEPLKENLSIVLEEHPELSEIKITVLNEDDAEAEQLDHYYAPAFFVNAQRISEGDGSPDAIKNALFKAL